MSPPPTKVTNTGSFRHRITKGSPHFPPEKGRYLLIVGLFCPFATRAVIVRDLKGLQSIIPMSTVHPYRHSPTTGFQFTSAHYLGQGLSPTDESENNGEVHGVTGDPVYQFELLREYYFKDDLGYQGKYTVPVLWDLKTEKIVNNESEDIIRMMYTEFDEFVEDEYKGITYYPAPLAREIDATSQWIVDDLVLGVYKTGINPTTQAAYQTHVSTVFSALDRLEVILGDGREFVLGSEMTEVDIKLFTCLIRFDIVYHSLFKCNLRSIRTHYPHLHTHLRRLYWLHPAFQSGTDFDHIKIGYFAGMAHLNPGRLVPVGPEPSIEPL